MAKEKKEKKTKEVAMLVVKGKYADAIKNGVKLSAKIKTATADLAVERETILDKENKIPDGEQSVRLTVADSDATALLKSKRTVLVEVTPELKEGLLSGRYNGTVSFKRNVVLENPDDMNKVLAVLAAAGIPVADEWEVKTTAVALDKYREENGVDPVLKKTMSVSDVTTVEFEVKD